MEPEPAFPVWEAISDFCAKLGKAAAASVCVRVSWEVLKYSVSFDNVYGKVGFASESYKSGDLSRNSNCAGGNWIQLNNKIVVGDVDVKCYLCP